MIDEKKIEGTDMTNIPKRIFIIDYQLEQCEVDGISDARLNARPFRTTNGNLVEYLCLDTLWHDASEEPKQVNKDNEFVECLVQLKDGELNILSYDTWHHWWVCNIDNEAFLNIASRWLYIDDLMKGGK